VKPTLPPCPVCGFGDWPEGGMHAARNIHIRSHDKLPCCDMHNRNCEPPYELCCERCTEAAHGLLGVHSDGSACIAPDLSGFTLGDAS
jgi:hypothetical protein